MSIALPEASEAPAAVPPSDITDARRAAYEDGQPLLPRLSALGVRIGDSTPGYGTIPGVLLRDVTDVQREWVVGLADELSPETRERVLASLFARALDIDSERPLVIQRQEKGKPMGSLATWCPRDCVVDHTEEVTQGTALEDLGHYIGESVEMTLPYLLHHGPRGLPPARGMRWVPGRTGPRCWRSRRAGWTSSPVARRAAGCCPSS